MLEFCLDLGPAPGWDDGFTDEDLEFAWEIHGAKIMEGRELRHGSRPWGWWVFEKGEEPPPLEPGANEIRRAELGELSEEEIADLARRAAEAKAIIDSGKPRGYVSTGGGGPIDIEQDAVDLWERVQKALKR
jgi:hypothetical protein